MNTRRNFVLQLIVSVLALLLTSIGLGLFSLYFSTGKYGIPLFDFYMNHPAIVILNIIPFVLLGFLFFLLTNRVWAGFALNSLACFLFSWSNYWKLLARDSPVVASDLLILSEAINIGDQYIIWTPQIIVSFLLSVLFSALFSLFIRFRVKSGRCRIVCILIVALLCCFLLGTVYQNTTIYDNQEIWPELTVWFPTTQSISRGGIYPFLYSIQFAFPEPPAEYDAKQTRDNLASYQIDNIPEDRQVNVIFVMLEAFSDFSGLTDKLTVNNPYEIYHALQEESYHGTLITNVFAGGTNITERNVITGFPNIDSVNLPCWSYARYFAEQGYSINGAHAGRQGFYNRININRFLGFPEYRFIDNYYSTLPEDTLVSWNKLDEETRYYLDNLYSNDTPLDFQFLPEITDYCKRQIEEGNPVFSFNVTYQNHGPYFSDRAVYPKAYVSQEDIPEADYHIANHYFAGVYDTSIHMQNMVDSFRDYGEPVILVFFGDHKPWFGEQNSTYQALGIDISSGSGESSINYYSTEYMIWANDSAKKRLDNSFVGNGPTISPCFLMNILFDQCGWGGPEYKKLTDRIMNITPVVHTTGNVLLDGQLVPKEYLDEDQINLLNALMHTEYYYMHDYIFQ